MSSSALEWVEENPGKAVLAAGALVAAVLGERAFIGEVFEDALGLAAGAPRKTAEGIMVQDFSNGLRFTAHDGLAVDVLPGSRGGFKVMSHLPDARAVLELTDSRAVLRAPGVTIRAGEGQLKTTLEDGNTVKSSLWYKPTAYHPLRIGDTVVSPTEVRGNGFSIAPRIIPRQMAPADIAWRGNFGGHQITSEEVPMISLTKDFHVSPRGVLQGEFRGGGSVSPSSDFTPFRSISSRIQSMF